MTNTNYKTTTLRILYAIPLTVSLALISACATTQFSNLPTSFNNENILKIKQGMSSKEILSMFGPPKNVAQAVCGSETGKTWTCTTWEYGKFPYDRASFTFGGDAPNLFLNNFKVDRD